MLSKKHQSDRPVAIDTGDQSLVYFGSKGSDHLIASKQFEPWYFGDTISYVCARRGAGKSTYCQQYIDSYVKATDGRVFLISRFENDPSLTLPERGLQLSIEDLVDLELSDLSNSLIVFDDVHSSSYSKQERLFLDNFIKDVILNSRHFQLSALITSHLISQYQKTREILNECSSLVVFPQYSNRYHIERALRVYFGLSKQQINQIMNLQSTRWVQIQTVSPKFVLTQHEIYTYN